MTAVWINAIGSAVPPYDIHLPFVQFARSLLPDDRARATFERMAERSGIAHRYSFLPAAGPEAPAADGRGFYRRGAFPTTASRMALYEQEALTLAAAAVASLNIGDDLCRITHLIVASCTGFVAPGLDLLLVQKLGLQTNVERTLVGFMGCAAAVPSLRLAYHTVRSDPAARVLVVSVELSTLHLQETSNLETILSFLLFGDGAAAALVTAKSGGIELESFRATIIPDTQNLITWKIGDQGFDMHLSGQVPLRIAQALRDPTYRNDLFGGGKLTDFGLWAIHGGGRTVLDATEAGLALGPEALTESRAILHDFGNVSSATVMFVLRRMLRSTTASSKRGVAIAFGPGMVAESFRFRLAPT